MAAKTQFLTYNIVLTDPDEVARLQALYPSGVNRAPYNAGPPAGGAAIEFNAPFRGYAQPALDTAPYTWTPWSGVTSSAGPYPINVAKFTRKTGGFLGIGGTTVTYYWIGQFEYAGSKAIPPGGIGDESVDAPDLEEAPLSLRRWIEGWEVPGGGASGAGIQASLLCSPDAARWVGGLGLAYRGASGVSASISPIKYRAGATQAGFWERGYIRLRKLPTGSAPFWSCIGTPTATNGLRLDITATGQIAVINTTLAGNVLLGTLPDILPVWSGLSTDDAWRRLDILGEYANGNPNGYVRIFIDGVLVATFVIPAADGGMGSGTRSQASRWGEPFAIGNQLEIDFDDCVNNDLPPGQDSNGTNGASRPYIYDNAGPYQAGDLVHTADGHVYKCVAPSTGHEPSPRHNGAFWHRYEGKDWRFGSHVLLSKPKAFGALHSVNWTGNFRTLQQNRFLQTLTAAATITSSTASALAEADMDTVERLEKEVGAIGAVAMVVSVDSARGANSGTLGYNINAAGAVDTAIVEAGTRAWNTVLYPGPVGTDVVDVSPLVLRYTKGSSADAASVAALLAQIEVLGTFDRGDFRPTPEGGAWATTKPYTVGDVVGWHHEWYTALLASTGVEPPNAATWEPLAVPAFPRYIGQHNAPYRFSQWSVGSLAGPTAPYIVHGGTYVGNGTGQDLLFRAPVGFLFIRPLTGGTGGALWWSSMLASKNSFGIGNVPNLSDAGEDLTFVGVAGEDAQQQRFIIRIAGANSQINQNAVTYQFIAIEDPGERFMLNGAIVHNTNLATDADFNFVDPAFTPDWAFFHFEDFSGTTTNKFYGKGPGNAAQSMAGFSPAVIASAVAFGLGKLTTRANFHGIAGGAGGAAFSVFRRADGNNDPGQASVVNIGSYIGDGSASRTIGLAPASGKRPLFALFFAESGSAGYERDPSQTGSNSTPHGGTDTTTGITAGGIDSISVGSSLNGNGIVYNYFVLFAGTTAGNNGWGVNGEYFPVEANSPATGPWPPDPDPTIFDEPDEPEVEPPDDEPDLDDGTPLPGTDLFCVDFTLKLVNQALSRIGVNKRIRNLITDTTIEADTARLHIKQDVDATLRRFPWPFATKYADLVTVGGTADVAVNQDWQYSYRAPTDMVYARRLVNQAGLKRGADPDPPDFRFASDPNGGLVYADADVLASALSLEYTARNQCPAFFGDPVFRDALIWRIAASLAPSLSKDSKKADTCLAQFERVISQAETIAANESRPNDDAAGDAPWIRDRQ